MAKPLPRPNPGECWHRVKNCHSAGQEVAYIREVTTGPRPRVLYATDPDGPITRGLELRPFLESFAPPGTNEPAIAERDAGEMEDCRE